MTIIAFAGDGIKIVSDGNGVTITKEAENWGDLWPQQETSIRVADVGKLIQALQEIQKQRYKDW